MEPFFLLGGLVMIVVFSIWTDDCEKLSDTINNKIDAINATGEPSKIFSNLKYQPLLQFRNMQLPENILIEKKKREEDRALDAQRNLCDKRKAVLARCESELAEHQYVQQTFISKPCQHGVENAFVNISLCPTCVEIYRLWYWNHKQYTPEAIEKDIAFFRAEYQAEKDAAAEREKLQESLRRAEQQKKRREEFQLMLRRAEQQRIATLSAKIDEYKYKKNLTSKEVGDRYERYIGYLFEKEGYRVDYTGITDGVDDDGVDIVASKKDIYILIQCKNIKESNEIHIRHIRQFNDKFLDVTEDLPHLQVSARFYTTHDNLDERSRRKLAKTKIEHYVIPQTFDYPLIKCNIGKKGEKIYHLPGQSSYDRIKIEYDRQELYAHTISEAESLGFRSAIN